jgi:hypothetical protein
MQHGTTALAALVPATFSACEYAAAPVDCVAGFLLPSYLLPQLIACLLSLLTACDDCMPAVLAVFKPAASAGSVPSAAANCVPSALESADSRPATSDCKCADHDRPVRPGPRLTKLH